MKRSLLWRILQVPGRILTTTLFQFQAYGTKNVPRTGGVLLAANHQSYLDPVLIAVQLKRPVSFFAKSELFEHPLFSWLIRSLHAFPVRQGSGDVAAVKEAIKRLQEGHALNVYPEGTRTLDGELSSFEKGISLLIRKSAVPVVPVAIEGSFACWPKGQLLPRPGKVRLLYGKPMTFEGKSNAQVLAELETAIRGLIAELRTIIKRET